MTRPELIDIIENGLLTYLLQGGSLRYCDVPLVADFIADHLINESGLRSINDTLKNL